MSLITDKAFYEALTASSEIVAQTDGRIYNTSIPVPDEQLDNEPLPYLIITLEGVSNEGMTKDNPFEGDTDVVTIGVLGAAADRASLGQLLEAVRTQIRTYFTTATSDLAPVDYQFSAGAVQYDSIKPCYYQTLQYQCDTTP